MQVRKQSSAGVLLVMVAALLLGVAVFLLLPWLLAATDSRVWFGDSLPDRDLAVANALRSPKRTVSTGRAVLVGVLVGVCSTERVLHYDRIYGEIHGTCLSRLGDGNLRDRWRYGG